MKQNFKEITNKVLQGSSKLNNLNDKIKAIKSEGRTREWERGEIAQAVENTRNELRALSVKRKVDLAYQKDLANKVVEPSHEYTKRTYHLNRAVAMAGNRSGQEVVNLYKHILNNPEAKQFKSEYEEVFLPRLGVDHVMEFDIIRRENMTEDELHQERFHRAIESVENHLKTIDGLEDGALQDIEVGKYDPNSDAVQHGQFFDEMLNNAEQNANMDKPAEPSQEKLDMLDPLSQ